MTHLSGSDPGVKGEPDLLQTLPQVTWHPSLLLFIL